MVTVVMSVLAGHAECASCTAAHRPRQGFAVEEGVVLNRLRRQTERWTDMLLGYLATEHQIADFAFNPEHTQDFAADVHDERQETPGNQAWQLAVTSLRATFECGWCDGHLNADLNRQIASSILACFHSELCDSGGLLRRAAGPCGPSQIADDTQKLVDDLLQESQLVVGSFRFQFSARSAIDYQLPTKTEN